MIFEHLTVGPLQANCYLLGDENTGKSVLIDPGAEGARLCARIRELGLELSAILNTHAHFDHLMAAWTVRAGLGGKIHLHKADRNNLIQVIFGLAARFAPEVRPVTPDEVDHWFEGEEELSFGQIVIRVLETPGHTPGHVAYYLGDSGMLFSGDTIFAGSIGRTDFPGGSHERLLNSVRSTIFTLPEDTVIWPGHGPRTTVGTEKRHNPFFP